MESYREYRIQWTYDRDERERLNHDTNRHASHIRWCDTTFHVYACNIRHFPRVPSRLTLSVKHRVVRERYPKEARRGRVAILITANEATRDLITHYWDVYGMDSRTGSNAADGNMAVKTGIIKSRHKAMYIAIVFPVLDSWPYGI